MVGQDVAATCPTQGVRRLAKRLRGGLGEVSPSPEDGLLQVMPVAQATIAPELVLARERRARGLCAASADNTFTATGRTDFISIPGPRLPTEAVGEGAVAVAGPPPMRGNFAEAAVASTEVQGVSMEAEVAAMKTEGVAARAKWDVSFATTQDFVAALVEAEAAATQTEAEEALSLEEAAATRAEDVTLSVVHDGVVAGSERIAGIASKCTQPFTVALAIPHYNALAGAELPAVAAKVKAVSLAEKTDSVQSEQTSLPEMLASTAATKRRQRCSVPQNSQSAADGRAMGNTEAVAKAATVQTETEAAPPLEAAKVMQVEDMKCAATSHSVAYVAAKKRARPHRLLQRPQLVTNALADVEGNACAEAEAEVSPLASKPAEAASGLSQVKKPRASKQVEHLMSLKTSAREKYLRSLSHTQQVRLAVALSLADTSM